LKKLDIVPPGSRRFLWSSRVSPDGDARSMDGTWALDGIVRFVEFDLAA